MAPTTRPLPLAQIAGPQLAPFRGTATADIEFEHFLGSDKDLDSKVWRVCIDGETYALKIEYIDYLDPFHCECRAYGRLKQEDRQDLAIRAHGYILLTQAQEQHVTEALGEEYVDWEEHPEPLDCSGVFTRWEDHRHYRVRAIVKEYVPSLEPWTASQIPRMYADLEDLHKLGILVRDIHEGNYLSGKLVDFSQAWAMYHPCLDRGTPRGVYERRKDEPQKFEEMVEVWAATEKIKIEKPAGLLKWHSGQESDFGFDPRQYRWQEEVKIEPAGGGSQAGNR
ncbi:hypothetical protein J7T55_001290 [Diaporthe amygdali]|uniref:uncharacterized protein n=1 Tax=Phomopsis amygdali TaxID=1214568 RepID=UPI0022FEB843|nr:uncharacterized protein J7T55_001290 [Diaporthe amygdali]KAJ0106766.1 hypothetical protein J7T55_001290 [Diaporthe amygdali]